MALFTLGRLDALIGIIDRSLNGTCNSSSQFGVSCRPFGVTSKGEQVDLYTLKNDSGMEIEIINYGGHIRCVRVPNKNDSSLTDVTIGLDNVLDYQYKNRYFGCIVGRYANRICKGKFTLNDKEYKLAINNGPNALHGGIDNFSSKVWNTTVLDKEIGINLHYFSEEMEEGYPGTLDVNVQYILDNKDNTLRIRYNATTDSSTVLNLTNHAYWNLEGDFKQNGVVDASHLFRVNSDFITAVDDTCIPNGTLMSVVNTPFDLRTLTGDIGERIMANIGKNEQMKNGNGFDHNFVIKKPKKTSERKDDDEVSECAVVIGKKSGIQMTVLTDQPGVQLYTANWLNGSFFGKGKAYGKRCAFCLETQHFPDSPNRKTFPSTVLKKGDVFNSTTLYRFSVVK